MLKISQNIKYLLEGSCAKKYQEISSSDLKSSGLKSVNPYDYQLFGINWLLSCYATRKQAGVILADEMGLGKTLQSVAVLLQLKSFGISNNPLIVLAPLSVIDSWKKEFERCAPSLIVCIYIGSKETRESMRESVANKPVGNSFDVLLTSYEVCLKDSAFLARFQWELLIVDEAHRLKNHKSMLYEELNQLDIGFKVLLTGTPVQNNLKEIYSLLSFVAPSIFPMCVLDEFVEYFSTLDLANKKQELHALLKPFVLRRTKTEVESYIKEANRRSYCDLESFFSFCQVMTSLPKKTEVLIHCGLSKTQKKIYKAILTKDISVFDRAETGQKTRLMNVLMQLRKCCNHPYIFLGVEEEPFELGEHLIETSGKLHLLDKLLKSLKENGHKVLLFSQMTTMLDIVQDYLGYRGYTYERLDGSIRGEERFLAVHNFNSTSDTFIFLLSTKAGGQGLNLMSADTVIFMDSDFNPQNDLQAAARAHRIGQNRPVKIIRLHCKNTVEEIILKRAEQKLKLTSTVIGGGQFSNMKVCDDPAELCDILKFGLEDLMKDENMMSEDIDFESILGRSCNGEWVIEPDIAPADKNDAQQADVAPIDMYEFEGENYSKNSKADELAFEKLVEEVYSSFAGERTLRRDPKGVAPHILLETQMRKRKVLTEEEKASLKVKREETKAKKIKLQEEQNTLKLEKLWKSQNYISYKILSEDDDSDVEDLDERGTIEYVIGDVTLPQHTSGKDAIVAHCVDDSGYWGKGGLFSAISHHSQLPKEQYELASKMKDLLLGSVHLVKFKDQKDYSIYAALIVAQTRDKNNRVSQLFMSHLSTAFHRIYHVAKQTGASVHFPRIGYNTPNFNWYGTEKLIQKVLARRGVRTFVYYYKRARISPERGASILETARQTDTSESRGHIDEASTSTQSANPIQTSLPDIFAGCTVYFHGTDDPSEERRLSRYIIAYDGDVEREMSFDVTHVICTSESKKSLSDVTASMHVVTSDWIDDSVQRGRLISEEEYVC